MAVLDRSELQASPLADLHAIADQLGLDGFRRLRKADLIDAILRAGSSTGDSSEGGGQSTEYEEPGERPDDSLEDREDGREPEREQREIDGSATVRGRRRTARPPARRSRRTTASGSEEPDAEEAPPSSAQPAGTGKTAEGVVELLGNGSAFLRVDPPEPSDEDVYISAAQVRRCELVSGDRVSGPVRTPRRSERYPSLTRIDTINGEPAEKAAEGARFEDIGATYPTERLALASEDPTLEAIEWLAPFGRGSRVVLVGAALAGKTETLRRLLSALAAQEELEVTLVLAGVRPEEIAHWQEGPVAPFAALTFAASADAQGQAVERSLDPAKRVAARGGHALVLIDSLDGMHPHAARKALASARRLRDGGSLTVIATASGPLGGETTVIALDVALTSTGRQPILDLLSSGTLRPELLVGEEGARAIAQARAAAIEAAG